MTAARVDTNHTSGLYRARPFDELAVEVAMQGRGRAVRPSERAEAVRRLARHGLSGREIAKTLGVSDRTVWRIYAWLRDAS